MKTRPNPTVPSTTTSTALAALLAFTVTPACSSADKAGDEPTGGVTTISSSSSSGESASSSSGATATGGAGTGGAVGTGGVASTGGSASTGGAGGDETYADPTCEGLALDPWQRDAQGWTVLPSVTQAGRRVIYVSAANAGKASPDPSNPNVYYVTTPEAGVALLRSGQPDSLLFNRGETFQLKAAIDSHGMNGGSGIADAKVIGAYGTGARPILMWNQAHSIIAVESYAAQHLIITQLDLEPSPTLAQQGTGITLSSSTLAHVLVEDVKINGFQKGMDIESCTDAVVRRSEIVNSCGGYRSQGIYVQSVDGFTLDENMMDLNGLQTCGKPIGSPEGQGVYVQSVNACFRARGNVLSRSLGNTLEARVGGEVSGNVFIGSATALNYGYVLGGSIEGKTMPRGVYGQITGNVFLDNQRGVQFGNTAMALFSHNVMAATVPVDAALAIIGNDGIGITGLTISDNKVSEAKYFVTYQGMLPAGPVTLKNDGASTVITNCDGSFGPRDAYVNGTLIFKYMSTVAATPPATGSCYEGLLMNGAGAFTLATPSVEVIDASLTGIPMLPNDPPVSFTAPNALTGNSVSWTRAPFENGTTALQANPATFVPEAGDDLTATFTNPKASIADVLGSEAAFYAAMAAQSHDAWNTKITAATIIPYFQAAYAPKP
jgi:hypothetical protein